MRNLTISLLLACLTLAACGGRNEPEYGQVTPDMPGGFSLPEPKQAMPAYAVFPRNGLAGIDTKKVRRLDEVEAIAPLRVSSLDVKGPEGAMQLQVASTPPLEFRSVSPEPTRDADFVWTALIGGRAVVTYDAADRLGVEGADRLEVEGLPGLRVGAFAENGAPSNFADILVSDHIVEQLPGKPIEMLIVGTDGDFDPLELAGDLKEIAPRSRLLPLVQVISGDSLAAGEAPQPIPQGRAEAGLGGTMTFTILEDGWIRPDAAWVEANLVQASVPIVGTVTCHRVMMPQLVAALDEIVQDGLAELIRPEDYAGCYAPRFIDRNPKLPLSNHAFGLAIDFNSDTNQLGTRGDMDPRIVEIFEKWGFEWGGRWDRPDPMHFELARLLQS